MMIDNMPANAIKGNPTNFLWFTEKACKVDAAAKAYIKLGEGQSLHTRYKCRVRSPLVHRAFSLFD